MIVGSRVSLTRHRYALIQQSITNATSSVSRSLYRLSLVREQYVHSRGINSVSKIRSNAQWVNWNLQNCQHGRYQSCWLVEQSTVDKQCSVANNWYLRSNIVVHASESQRCNSVIVERRLSKITGGRNISINEFSDNRLHGVWHLWHEGRKIGFFERISSFIHRKVFSAWIERYFLYTRIDRSLSLNWAKSRNFFAANICTESTIFFSVLSAISMQCIQGWIHHETNEASAPEIPVKLTKLQLGDSP